MQTSLDLSTLRGSVAPRIATPPLRDLDHPRATYGHAVIRFAREVLGRPLTPAQEGLVIHAGELLEDGRPRFRRVLVIQSRQSGKTTLLATLSLFWLYAQKLPLILGTSTTLATARDAWQRSLDMAEDVHALAKRITQVRRANDSQFFRTTYGSTYAIVAAGRKGGRGLSIDRLIMDEVRELRDWEAYNAAYPAMAARPYGQAWFISNMGGLESVVLNSLRATALAGVDDRLGAFEWSAPHDADPLDPAAWCMASPNLGIYQDASDLASAARSAVERGGAELTGFLTERLCIPVQVLDPAIDPTGWARGQVPGDLVGARGRVALVLDVAPDGQHATVCAAGLLPDMPGKARVAVVDAWEGPGAGSRMVKALPEIVGRVRPRVVGWLPGGPAAALAADLRPRGGWPPAGVQLVEIKSDTEAVCMGFASVVTAGDVLHAEDALLDAHAGSAERLAKPGGRWVFSRKSGHVDALYAAAGAVHLARTMPPPRSRAMPAPLEQ